MSSITPPSFVDDGLDVQQRMPGAWNIGNWVNGTTSPNPANIKTPRSTYTQSFIDDGADLFPPSVTPGLGKLNATFYEEKEWTNTRANGRQKRGSENVNPYIQKAISGDIHATLMKMQQLSRINVVATIPEEEVEKVENKIAEEKEKEVEGVLIMVPRPPPIFVIHGEDGRVTVVDHDGEYDTGPIPKQVVGSVTNESDWGDDGWDVGTLPSPRPSKDNPEMSFPPPPPVPLSKVPSRWPKAQRVENEKKKPTHAHTRAPKPPSLVLDRRSAHHVLDPNTFMSGALGGWPKASSSGFESPVKCPRPFSLPSPFLANDSWKSNVDKANTYKAPTVEDAFEEGGQETGEVKKLKNGYDEANETWLNAQWGPIKVRESRWD
ncbi:hypothetical protein BDV95DRAFT_607558 [Massariosphaeria phaeospora]|uniref:Uncharacterized protein n=1 Tax=Massariosphaeria phaeospora TaxID=100035 RepID=A0A7C8M9G0_9PLEO|nr:hypothetical protein BDV95DRAFT_607558 [Massariosphaeria phaeospora]